MNEFLENRYIKLISILVIPLGFFADGMSNSEYFLGVLAIILFFFILAFIDNKKMKDLYNKETIPIPIVINVDSNQSTSYVLDHLFKEIESNSNFKNLRENLKHYRDIVTEDLVFEYKGDLYDKERLISFIQIIKYQITKIKENTPNKVQFHLAYYQKPAVGFLIGYIFDSEDLVIYQKNPDIDSFDKVAKVEKRNYKSQVNKFEKFNIEVKKEDKSSDTVLLAIKASSHNIALNANSLASYSNIVSMAAKHSGTIALDEDWILYAREIFSVLNKLQTEYKNITVAHNMPESIAIILGMAIGNYWNIQMTQYDRGEYIDLIKLDEIKCYF